MHQIIHADHPWWSERDREVLLAILRRVDPRSVLEFGPGLSTATMVEHGCRSIHTFEDEPAYYDRAVEMFRAFPQVEVRCYQRRDPLSLRAEAHYDLGFVDGPHVVAAREPELAFALARCRAVVVHDSHELNMSRILGELSPRFTVEDYLTDFGPPGTTHYGMALVS